MAAPSLLYAVAVLSLVVVLVVVESGSAAPPPDTRIVGGRKIEIDDAPWQVALMFLGDHVCGGSIISPQWVLTSAFCTLFKQYFLFTIRIGSKLSNDGGRLYDVMQMIVHGEYGLTDFHDVSLLKTSTPMDLSAPVRAVRLPALGDKRPSVGTMLTVTGWGLTENEETTSELMSVDVQLQEYEHCKDYAETSEEIGLCVGLPGKGYCDGDFGGPLVMGDLLVGVVSAGDNATCGSRFGYYTDITVYREWIQQHAGL